MHEHVGDELPDTKMFILRKVQGQPFKHGLIHSRNTKGNAEEDDINNNQNRDRAIEFSHVRILEILETKTKLQGI